MSSSTILTPDGHKKLIEELQYLKTTRRNEIAERIEYAKSLGDLSENAEYQSAREDQAFTEGRILELEEMLKNAQVVQHITNSTVVSLGDSFIVSSNGNDYTFQVVGANESNPQDKKISNESPLGRAVLGESVGKTISVSTPRGVIHYRIEKIL